MTCHHCASYRATVCDSCAGRLLNAAVASVEAKLDRLLERLAVWEAARDLDGVTSNWESIEIQRNNYRAEMYRFLRFQGIDPKTLVIDCEPQEEENDEKSIP